MMMSQLAKIAKEKDLKIEKINEEYNKKIYELTKELEQGMYKLVPEIIYCFDYDDRKGEMSFKTNNKLSKEILLKICQSTMMDLERFEIITHAISTDDDGGLEQGIWLPLEYSEEYKYIFSSYFYCETRSRMRWRENK